MIEIFEIILLVLLVICAISVCFIKNNLTAIIVFSSYSSIMAVIWCLLEAPDLAITEAAVGAGVTTVLFFVTLKRINQIDSSLNTIEYSKKEGDHHEENK